MSRASRKSYITTRRRRRLIDDDNTYRGSGSYSANRSRYTDLLRSAKKKSFSVQMQGTLDIASTR